MLTQSVYNKNGEEVGKVNLPKEIFGLEVNNDLIYQAVNAQLSERRVHLAKTKDRSEVRGGGKKPWRQKGTGRARHGSIRSPLWIGGGVTFGPIAEKIFQRKINKKAKRKALFEVLSSKVKDKEMIILDEFKIQDGKTKPLIELINNIIKEDKKPSILMVISQKDEALIRASRNISYLKMLSANSLNVVDLLSSKCLLMDKGSIEVIKKTYFKKPKTQNSNTK